MTRPLTSTAATPRRPHRGASPLARLLCTLALTAAALALTGCVSVSHADAMRLTHPPTDRPFAAPVWPERNPEWAQSVVSTWRGTHTMIRQTVIRDGTKLIPFISRSQLTVTDATLTDFGALLEVKNPPESPQTDDADRRSSLLIFSSLAKDAPAIAPDPRTEIGGIAMDVYPPLGTHQAPAGIVVHMQGLAGVEYEQPVVDALRRRGFIEVRTEFPWARWQPVQMELGTPEAVFDAAEKVARMADDCLAEAAYSVEGAIEHLWRTRPELRNKPIVLMGFSAGSLALPAVGAKLGDRLSAAVIVGSGANIVRITQTSELTDAGMKILLLGKPASGAMAGLLAGEYLRRSTLDPFHAAGALRDKPVLQLHASTDGIVPAELGDELYEQLARPERWTFPGGHRLLFLQLESWSEDIARWVVDALAARNRVAPAAGDPNTANLFAPPGSLLKPL